MGGPQPGVKLPPFTAILLRRPRKGQQYDPVAAANGKPQVLIFQDNSVVDQKGLLLCGGTLAQIDNRSPLGLSFSTTFLVDDPEPSGTFKHDLQDQIADVIEMSISVASDQ